MSKMINIKIIEDYIDDNNMSKTKFCKLCNISSKTLNNILKGKDIMLNTLFKISRAIDSKLSDFFKFT